MSLRGVPIGNDFPDLFLDERGPDRGYARLHSGALARILSRLLRAEAFVLGRRVFLSASASAAVARRSRDGLVLLAHELAHVEQFRRHGTARFLLRYVAEYLAARRHGASHTAAYRSISFEREAERARDAEPAPARASPAGSRGYPQCAA